MIEGQDLNISSSRTGQTISDVHDMLSTAALVLLDLDGCLAFGNEPHAAASTLLKQLDSRYVVLSNNSTQTPAGLAAELKSRGLSVDPARIILAGALMIDRLAVSRREASIALFAAAEIETYALSKGLLLSSTDDAEIVALARDTAFTYDKLQRGVGLLAAGAKFIVSNPDLTHPGPQGIPVPETGSLLKAFHACIPGVTPEIVGKPSPTMFEAALQTFGGTPATTIMVGDNPMTDGRGAEQAGIRALLVGPGNPHESIAALVK